MRHLRSAVLLVLFSVSAAQAQVSVSVDLSRPDPNPAVSGTQLDFVIAANNEGPNAASNVEIDTAVPANSTFVAMTLPAGWSCTTPAIGGTGSIVCTAATLAVGTDQLQLSVTTAPGTPQGTVIELDATISTTSNDVDPNDNSATLTVPLVWQTPLTLAKSAPSTAFAGQTFSYVITVNNPGPSYASDLSVTDTLPAQTSLVSISAPGWSCSGTTTITCTMAQLAVTSSTITIQVSTAPSFAGGTITNDVSLTASSDSRTDTASASTSIGTSADLSLTKSEAPQSPVAGQDITYTLTATNAGPSDALNAVVTDTLPSQVQFVSFVAPAGWSCSGTSTVTCTNADFAPGSAQITITAHVSPAVPLGTTIANTASITSSTSDPSTANNSATSSGATTTPADVAITTFTVSPNPVVAGQQVTYSLTLTNNGPSNAANATLSLALPSTLSLVSITPPAGWNCTATTCTNPSLAAATPQSFTIVANVSPNAGAGTTITTTATATSANDINSANNSATASTTVSSPANVSVAKSVTGAFFETGVVTYTITLTNSAATAQSDNPGNEMVDVLPSSVTLLGASASSGTVATSGNTVTWNGSIAGGGSVTVTISARINGGTAGTTISNVATANYDADGNGTNESSRTSAPASFTAGAAAGIPTMSTVTLLFLAIALAAAGVIVRR